MTNYAVIKTLANGAGALVNNNKKMSFKEAEYVATCLNSIGISNRIVLSRTLKGVM